MNNGFLTSRWMNKGRQSSVSHPDIDIDVSQNKHIIKDEVWVYEQNQIALRKKEQEEILLAKHQKELAEKLAHEKAKAAYQDLLEEF